MAIFTLACWGGMRCPSEVLGLRWEDVLWDKRRLVVRSPKTERHAGKEFRITPLFPKVESVLADCFEAAPDGAGHVVTKPRDSEANLRTTMQKIIARGRRALAQAVPEPTEHAAD